MSAPGPRAAGGSIAAARGMFEKISELLAPSSIGLCLPPTMARQPKIGK